LGGAIFALETVAIVCIQKQAARRIGRYDLSATGSQKPMIYPTGANGITIYSREHKRGIMGARQGMVTLR